MPKKNAAKKKKGHWQVKAEEYLEGWRRERANFENYRKQVERERAEVVQYAMREFIEEMLVVVSHFDMAVKQAEVSQNPAVAEWTKGLKNIKTELQGVLQRAGVTEIEPNVGEPFDSHVSEALNSVPSKNMPEGHIVEVLEKGYRLHDRVIRPAKVSVAAGNPS